MARKIPTQLGIITLALAGSACSDAAKVAKAFEKVCKTQCECEPQTNYWDDVKNCEKACEGYADIQEAYLSEQFDDEEPCDDIGKLAKDLKACAKESCGDDLERCVGEAYEALSECIGDGYSYYYGVSTPEGERPRRRAILDEVSAELLYGPWPLACGTEASDNSSALCSVEGDATRG